MAAISLNEPEMQAFIFYSAILALKLIALSALTPMIRIYRGAFANPEDAKWLGGQVKYDEPAVERVRRAHLNDLENIPAFWVLGALYLTTGPATLLATMLFRLFAAGRIIHTIVYAVVPLPQPTRAIAFGIPYFINWYMGIQAVLYYITAI